MPRSADSRAVGWGNDLHEAGGHAPSPKVDRLQVKMGSPQKNNNPVN
jgi:hypothetical protein